MKRFGIVTENICEYELNNLVGGADDVPKDVNAFYEMFIQDENGNLVDVPVLVTNLKDFNGDMPNLELGVNSQLVHRFFISETISGIESTGGFSSGDKLPVYLRYAESVKLRVQLDSN